MQSLLGITAKKWLRLLKDNSFAIDRPYWSKAIALTIRSFFNSLYYHREQKEFGGKLAHVKIEKPPIFIIGHWRSGTTLLHNLFSLDDSFCYPNLFEVYNPYTFLTLESIVAERLKNDPPIKRPMDNMEVKFDSPAEDEFALALLSLRSPLLSWPFPRREKFYDRYLTLRGVSDTEVEIWKESLSLLLKKLTLKYQRQLVLKSPSHTCRIKMILDMFPDARFIHIHRNPYTVFLSTRKLYDTAILETSLQRPITQNIDNGIIQRYALMYEAFFEERALIPKNQFMEIAFEDFEQNIMSQMEGIYHHLNIESFEKLKPKLVHYIASIKTYKKNVHPTLEQPLRQEIAQKWKRCFEEWCYDN